ncbi:hypothetical protein NW757_014564 [Fusarium falciforme]|nr:hypothetical protein NW757_014564 [Fusarium falciforme]
MALERLHARPRYRIPDLSHLIARARHEPLAIRREGHRGHPIAMALECLHACARYRIPDLDRIIIRG